jgi:hypothetical protein
MKGIKIPIFKHNDDTRTVMDLGMDYDYEDCDVEEITFYSIVAISEEIDGDNKLTRIHATSGDYISPLKVDVVEEMIKGL